MTSRAEWQKSPQQLHLIGEVQFDNVVALLREGQQWLEHSAAHNSSLNLGEVSYSNSAGVALIVGLHRQATVLGKALAIEQVPANLVSMMRLGGLEWLLNSSQERTKI